MMPIGKSRKLEANIIFGYFVKKMHEKSAFGKTFSVQFSMFYVQ